MRYGITIYFLLLILTGRAQQASIPWNPDNGDGTYTNPVIHADYSDPDVIRVGGDYYLISSSFTQAPGLPILHSKDLVHWAIIGHALPQLHPAGHFSAVQHGGGVWAPSIRYHNKEFYIYYPDPDFGIYLIKAKNITGPWSDPQLVEGGKGLIDPCPLWDDDGNNYLVHAYAGSRAGFKSILVIKPLNKEGSKTTGNAVMVFDGHDTDPTVEGPKLYKRNGYYYIFAPAGGVSTGWQLVLRSKNIYGPYERKVVMQQGNTPVNGPHQGAWVNTPTGEDWFLHFQDKEAYGRVVHLQPMIWKNDWPVIGTDADGDGTGEPVQRYRIPVTAKKVAPVTPQDTDEMNQPAYNLQWQWQANPQQGWAFPAASGYLRMFSVYQHDSTANLWNLPNILGQKLPAPAFTATVKLNFYPKHDNERIGLILTGLSYAWIGLRKSGDAVFITMNTCNKADKGNPEKEIVLDKTTSKTIYLRMVMEDGAIARFYFSKDGQQFSGAGATFTAQPGKWTGARLGIFCNRYNTTNDAGFADIDWIRFTNTTSIKK